MRRGIDRAEIYCICFDQTSKWLATTSDKGTLHIFSIGANLQRNVSSSKKVVGKIFPKYRNKQRSFAHLKINGARTLCSFLEDQDKIVVLNADGKYYMVTFNPDNADSCLIVEQANLNQLALDEAIDD